MRLLVLLPLLALACGSAAEREVVRYAALVGDPTLLPEPGLAACADLARSDLRADCADHVVTLEAARPGGRPEALCPRLEAGPYQDECWFLAAEAHGRRGQDASAAQLCKKAGAYKEDCAQHLWQTAVHDLIHKAGPRAMIDQLPRAQKLYAHWERYLGGETELQARFWARYFQNAFEGLGVIDLRWCPEVPAPALAQACEAAAIELFAQRLMPALDAAQVGLCDPAQSAEALTARVRCEPDARLTAVVEARRADRCGP